MVNRINSLGHQIFSATQPRKSNHSKGFSLLELAVVVAVISALSSMAIPGINRWIRSTKIDSAKSKLNSAAATCLQNIRSGADPSEPIDSSTLSNDLLESDGYKISPDMNSCATLMVQAAKEDDADHFPMGFAISDGTLTKFAFPTTTDSQQSCKAWAGSNCKESEELKKLIAHNKKVQEAKTSCNENFYAWLNGTPPGDGKRFRWNPDADSDCKNVPPANTGSTCTPSGCTLETWAFEGTIVAGEEGYKQALERKYGKICSEKLEQKRQQKYTGGPVSILECGAGKVMWFHDGVDTGSEEEMNRLICEDKQAEHLANNTTGATTIPSCGTKTFYFCLGEDQKTEELMQQCISTNEEASCSNAINEALANGHVGEFIAKQGGPGVCSTVSWMCKGKQFSSKETFESSDCGAPSCGDPPDQRCRDANFRNTRAGRRTCFNWSKCMGFF